MSDSLQQPSPLRDVPSYATGGTVTAEAFARIVANWACDAGLPRDSALIALGATSAFLEARRQHGTGASERVVRLQLDKALSDAGMDKISMDS